jgi:cytochrome P450
MEPTERSHEDIYNRQQATDLRIERIDGKLDNMLQLLGIRNAQSTERHTTTDRMMEDLGRKADEHSRDVWLRFSQADAAIERVRELSEDKIDNHRKDTDNKLDTIRTQLVRLDGKLLTLGGSIAVISFLLVLFAPIIQQKFLINVPATGSPQHYELRK